MGTKRHESFLHIPPQHRILLGREAPAEAPELDIYAELCGPEFYAERAAAFHYTMAIPRLIRFLVDYDIQFACPMFGGRPNPDFWTMIYTAVLVIFPPENKNYERAKIWMFCQQNVRCSVEHCTYTVNNKLRHLHPLLTRKNPANGSNRQPIRSKSFSSQHGTNKK